MRLQLFRRVSAIALAGLLLLSGCAAGESARLRAGRRLMEEYLSARGGGQITESWVEVLRPDADVLAESDYVKGSFRDSGGTCDFAVNTVTGAVYTSERLPEFRECCVRTLTERLGLSSADCVGNCAVAELYAPPWQEEKPEWPWARSYLGEVLPAELTDLDAYAARAITDGDLRLVVYIACRNTPLSQDRWTAAELADWSATEVTLLALPDPDAPLPAAEELTADYRNSFPGDRLLLSDREITFRQEEVR